MTTLSLQVSDSCNNFRWLSASKEPKFFLVWDNSREKFLTFYAATTGFFSGAVVERYRKIYHQCQITSNVKTEPGLVLYLHNHHKTAEGGRVSTILPKRPYLLIVQSPPSATNRKGANCQIGLTFTSQDKQGKLLWLENPAGTSRLFLCCTSGEKAVAPAYRVSTDLENLEKYLNLKNRFQGLEMALKIAKIKKILEKTLNFGVTNLTFESRKVGLGTTVEYIERKFKTKA